MKKLIATLVVGGFLAATLVGCGPANTTEPPKGAGPGGTSSSSNKETTTTGKISKVDGAKVTVKPTSGDEKTFTIPDSAKVMVDDKEGKPSDIKEGQNATITEDGGKITKVDIKTK
jgi:hypothetical protein